MVNPTTEQELYGTGAETWSDSCQEMLELHIALGLGVRHGPAVAVVPLTR